MREETVLIDVEKSKEILKQYNFHMHGQMEKINLPCIEGEEIMKPYNVYYHQAALGHRSWKVQAALRVQESNGFVRAPLHIQMDDEKK